MRLADPLVSDDAERAVYVALLDHTEPSQLSGCLGEVSSPAVQVSDHEVVEIGCALVLGEGVSLLGDYRTGDALEVLESSSDSLLGVPLGDVG